MPNIDIYIDTHIHALVYINIKFQECIWSEAVISYLTEEIVSEEFIVSIIVSNISPRKVVEASDKLLCLILKFLVFISFARNSNLHWIHLNCREACNFIFEKLNSSVFFIARFLMMHSVKIIFIKNYCDACFSMFNYLNLYISIFYENPK